ncbi:fumble [Coemansia reversa NRRL 1564]|uniref:Fumble n=1 Tax=Coemansia reversa (strain ATCC 12441 / NRRL 1564) TaxID=763665 RepID=A0A2G5B7L7_COERN|nr:fumble [Coemansia reversa NRRL 1564]|eukprot:PIA14999.1 fumble [Coemansia reversa NRRL 1564]
MTPLNIDNKLTLGIDVGGSLVKVVLEETDNSSDIIRHPLVTFVRNIASQNNGEIPSGWKCSVARIPEDASDTNSTILRALVLPTADIDLLINKVKHQSCATSTVIQIASTGGGALNYKEKLECGLCVRLLVAKELDAVAAGLSVDIGTTSEEQMLVCNIGTGVSLVSVDKQGKVERVSGSGIGGATFWGLTKRLTNFKSFDQAVIAAKKNGVLGKTDTLVEDIYGRETSKEIGLAPDLVAGFLGKLDASNLTDADISAALLRMFVSNIGQLAVFQARLLNVEAVWFTGGFVQSVENSKEDSENSAPAIVRQAITEAVSFWSANGIAARFPNNAALLGAIGAIHAASATDFDMPN